MVKEIPADSGDKKMEIDSNRSNVRLVADEKLDIEVSNVIGNSEINSSRNEDKAFANEKLEIPNIEGNDVTENSEDNLESLLGKKESLSNNYIEICELPAENRVIGSNNVGIYDLLTDECDHEEEIEMVKVSSNVINKDNDFNSEFLLEEDDLIKWLNITKSNLVTVTENEQGIETVQERKNKAYNCKEIDDSKDDTIEVFDFFTTPEEEELDEWLIKTDNPLNLEESDSIFTFETVSERNNLSNRIIKTKNELVHNKSDRIAKKEGDTEDDIFNFFTDPEEEKYDDWFIETYSPLKPREPDSIYDFETVSERN